MHEVLLVGAARTPIGLYMGLLADQKCQDIAACSMKEAIYRAGIDSSQLDACIYSEAIQTSLPANVGRHGWLAAGLDNNPAGYTLNSLCSGAIQTMFSAYNKLASGEYKGVLAGGVETHSQAPYYIYHPRYKFGPDSMVFHDQKVELSINAQPVEIYGELSSATLADKIADNQGLSRAALDEYTLEGKEKAATAFKNGIMKDVIVPIVKKVKKADVSIDADDGPKKATSIEKLMAMPAINCGGSASEGNVAQWADGSASYVMLSDDKAVELGCKALAKVIGFGITAGNPTLLDKTTVKSIAKSLKYAGIGLKDVDYIDMHEPSAAYAIAVANALGNDAAGKINVDGGSLAYGYVGAATGGTMLVNMVYRLQRTGAKIGLINVGTLGGQSLTVIISHS